MTARHDTWSVTRMCESNRVDIGDITMRSAASMAAAGNTLDETNYCLGAWQHAS